MRTRNPNSRFTRAKRSIVMIASGFVRLAAMDCLICPTERAESMINVLYEPVSQAPLLIPRAYTDRTYFTDLGQQLLHLVGRLVLHLLLSSGNRPTSCEAVYGAFTGVVVKSNWVGDNSVMPNTNCCPSK